VSLKIQRGIRKRKIPRRQLAPWDLGFGTWDLGFTSELPAGFLTSPATAATATTPAAATPASAESTTTAATRLLRPRFVHRQRASTEALLVELRDRILRVLIGRHFHEREAARPAGFAIPHDVHGRDIAGFRKQRGEVVFIGVVRE